jgi:hypothetical protein
MNTSRRNNEKKQKNKRNRQTAAQRSQNALGSLVQGQHEATLVVPRRSGFMPDRLRTTLRVWRSISANMSTTSYGIVRCAPTDVFDPLFNGTKPPGFVELSELYRSYRARSSRIVVEAANTSPDSIVRICVNPVNHDPGSTPTSGYVTSQYEQPYARNKSSPPLGGPLLKITSAMSTRKLYGTFAAEVDDNFSALVTGSPANNWYWIVSYYSLATIPSTDPLLINLQLEIEVDFFDRAFVQN